MNLELLTSELYELNLRAKKINYKNRIPQLPKNPTESTIQGFKKRLSNWVAILKHIESERMQGTIKSDSNLLRKYLN